ncbi:MAG: biotin carboxylase, partial [Lentisphaerae bacterium]|nr:biotin carboxylase [Lentisphaerota bacterium]
MPKSPILIVGTTSDYIDLISRQFSEEVLFLTDRMERSKAIEPQPPNGTEILTNLKNYEETFSALNAHFDKRGGKPAGITCFDCESMRLAARLAQEMSLRYPSPESIRICRNKYESKRLWRKAGLPCPRAELVYDADGALALQRQMEKTVIKPIAGSGSEYVFACNTQAECSAAVANIRFGLSEHKNDPMKPLY